MAAAQAAAGGVGGAQQSPYGQAPPPSTGGAGQHAQGAFPGQQPSTTGYGAGAGGRFACSVSQPAAAKAVALATVWRWAGLDSNGWHS